MYLFTGAADTGQGSNTALSQIAAQELGVSYSRFKCKAGDTEITPLIPVHLLAGSLLFQVMLLLLGARDAKKQMLEVVAKELQRDINELDIKAEKCH